MKKNILLTGGTGFVGQHLAKSLIENGFSVSILTRSNRQNTSDISYYKWDVDANYVDEDAVLNSDAIIHLAGENIAEKRWTSKRKKEIIDSRDKSVRLLYTILKKHNKKIDAFVSASAVGIYGAINGDEICTENVAPANDFLGTTCQRWESAADTVASLGIRTVKVRTGLVLGKNGGFLSKLLPLFKYRLGSALGSGKQYMPWIYIDDLTAIYVEVVQNKQMSGAYNAAIEDDTTNLTFSQTLAKIYGYSIWLPNVPEILIKLGLGEMSKMILTGRRVSSQKIRDLGFKFKNENLENTLKKCIE